MADKSFKVYDKEGNPIGIISPPVVGISIGAMVLIAFFGLIALSYLWNVVYPPCYGSGRYTIKEVSYDFNPTDKTVTLDITGLVNTGQATSNDLMLEVWASDAPFKALPAQGTKLGQLNLNATLQSGYQYQHLTETVKVETLPPFEQPKTIIVFLLEQCQRDEKFYPVNAYSIGNPYTFKKSEWRNHWWERLWDKLSN
jgi:hypothetical protein